MVKAYSRYCDSGSIGLLHTEGAGNTLSWSSSGKSLYSAVGTDIIEINSRTGVVVGTVSCSANHQDDSLNGSALSLHQPARVSCLESTTQHLGVGCTDGSVRIVELPLSSEERRVVSFQGHRGSVNAIAISGSGLVATGGRDTEIVVWDLVGESGICRLTGHKGEVTCLEFLPGNEDFVVSGSKDGTVKIWSVKLQICVQTVTEPKSEVWSLAFHHDQRLIVGSVDKVLHVYSIRSNLVIDSNGLVAVDFHGQLDRPEPADGRVMKIASTSCYLFAQTDRRVIEIWRVVTDEDEKSKRMKRRLKRGKIEQAEEDEGITTSTANDEFVIASSPENPSVALRYVAGSRVKSMSVFEPSSNGSGSSVALGLGDNQIELIRFSGEGRGEIKESRSIKREGHRNPINWVSVSSDGTKLISVSSDSMILWNAVSLKYQKSLIPLSEEILGAFFVPTDSDKLVLVSRDSQVRVMDCNSGSLVDDSAELVLSTSLKMNQKHKRKSKEIDLSNEAKCFHHYTNSADSNDKCCLLIGDKSRKVLNLQLDKETNQFSLVGSPFELPDEPVCLSISPLTNKYVAAGLLNSNVELVYADSGKHYMSLYSHKLAVSSVAFSPDEQVVVSGSSDKNIKIWSVKFGNVLKSIRAHDGGITSLHFIPHSHLVFSGSRDGVISLWDIDRFERVMSKVVHPSSEVLAITSSPDAGMVFTAGADRAIKRITRSQDQMFIEDEAEKAMEIEVDREAQRDDLVHLQENLPTKSSLESVRTLDKVVQMIEIDEEQLDHDPIKILEQKKILVKYIATDIPPSVLQQVIVTLPTGHARRLLSIIAEVMESAILTSSEGTKTFPLGFPVEQCVSAGLFLVQAQARFLIGEPHSRPVLIKLKELFHFAIQSEIENVGIAASSARLL